MPSRPMVRVWIITVFLAVTSVFALTLISPFVHFVGRHRMAQILVAVGIWLFMLWLCAEVAIFFWTRPHLRFIKSVAAVLSLIAVGMTATFGGVFSLSRVAFKNKDTSLDVEFGDAAWPVCIVVLAAIAGLCLLVRMSPPAPSAAASDSETQ